jgi:oligopeptide/dipeptide ABC transporter ATP-binding protein
MNLLEVNNLKTYFFDEDKEIPAVDGISFNIKEGEILGLVGESGSGKSVTSLSIMRLIQGSQGKIIDGKIIFKDTNIIKNSEKEMCEIRGKDISMIFQEPMTSLNPVFTCGEQIAETFQKHQNLDKKKARNETINILKLVEIPEPEIRFNEYPHQLSGGMRQRVMIAMALACGPSLLIADEPTTALDVTVQAQILDLIRNLNEKFGMAVLLITHDLGVIAEMADRVAVMYAGKIVETGLVSVIFDNPKHPYTIGLLNSIPKVDSKKQVKQKLITIPGVVPSPHEFPEGCRFNTRCKDVMDKCRIKEPPIIEFNIKSKYNINTTVSEKYLKTGMNCPEQLVIKQYNEIKKHFANCWLYE